MRRTIVFISVLAMIMTLVTVPVLAEEEPCLICGSCNECGCAIPVYPCYGDPRTQGFWKNHTELWDDEGLELPLGYNFQEWLDILNSPSDQGPWYLLAKQFIAAWLNFNVGEVGFEEGYAENVTDVINEMEGQLNYFKDDRRSIDRNYVLYYKDFLDVFNNYDI